MTEKQETEAGRGGDVVIATNVRKLVEASNLRQDDLRQAEAKFVASELQHVEKLATLHAAHEKELREAEAARVNAIRQVDVLAVNTAADRASAAIQALAATTSSNAETLRAMVANTAATIASQTQQTVQAITDRLTALERTSYTGMGKQAVEDPQMAQLLREVKALSTAQTSNAGKSEGGTKMWGYVVAGFGFLLLMMQILSYMRTSSILSGAVR